MKRGHIEKKTIKIDLDAISSGEDEDSDDSSSSEDNSQSYVQVQNLSQRQRGGTLPNGKRLESESLNRNDKDQNEIKQLPSSVKSSDMISKGYTPKNKLKTTRNAIPKPPTKVGQQSKKNTKGLDVPKQQKEMPPTSFEKLRQ